MTRPVIFLPGILMPARDRYLPLITALGGGDEFVTKELEIYAGDAPPAGYSIRTEVDGLERFARERDLAPFHLYGHSAGGSVALAYVAAHPDHVLTLAVDEPGTDFSGSDAESFAADLGGDFDSLSAPERMAVFARSLVQPDVELPPPPDGPPSPEMAKRPAGVLAFVEAMSEADVDPSAFARFDRPAYYSYGSRSNPRWEAMGERLKQVVPRPHRRSLRRGAPPLHVASRGPRAGGRCAAAAVGRGAEEVEPLGELGVGEAAGGGAERVGLDRPPRGG